MENRFGSRWNGANIVTIYEWIEKRERRAGWYDDALSAMCIIFGEILSLYIFYSNYV